MIRNYFLVALRNLLKDRLYVSINIVGLSVASACVLVILAFVRFELGYDTYHAEPETIYRVTEKFENDGSRVHSAMSHSPIAAILKNQLAGASDVTRILDYSSFFNAFVSAGPQNIFKENKFLFADSTFTRIFTLNSLTGPIQNALDKPNSVILTQSSAEKYFGSTEVVGKKLTFENDEESISLNITAVISDFPQNSHFRGDFIASLSTLDVFMPWYNNWHHPSMYVYFRTGEKYETEVLDEQIGILIRKHAPGYIVEENRTFETQKLVDIHLHSKLDNEWEANSNYEFIRIYGFTALFILLIACINYMNLSTARSSVRTKEVGVRKVFGSMREQLVFQFLMESLIYVIFSFIIGILIAELSLQFIFNDLIGKNISIWEYLSSEFLMVAIAFILLVAILAGLYPAFYLSSFKPLQALKNGLIIRKGEIGIRKALVAFQLVISCFLIGVTTIILDQVNYLLDKELGFDEDQIVILKLTDRHAQKNYQVLKSTLLGESFVKEVGLSSAIVDESNFYGLDVILKDGSNQEMTIKSLGVDEGFLQTYDIELKEGRDFLKEMAGDQRSAVLLNEAAVEKFGWSNPIGKNLEFTVYVEGPDEREATVIGVVKNFHFESLHKEIEPLILYINKHPYYADYLSIKVSPGNVGEVTSAIQNVWTKFNPDKPMDLQFLDDHLTQLYDSDVKTSRIFNLLAGLSIFISVLGLLGLSAFLAEKKTKEIGIRKTLGAGTFDILKLQYREFIPLTIIANIIVWPFIWIWSIRWLADFAYHVDPNPAIFAALLLGSAGLIVIITSLFLVGVAQKNPIGSLRNE